MNEGSTYYFAATAYDSENNESDYSEEISDSISRDDLEEWDSMTHLALVSELEQVFNIILSDDDVTEIKTIGDIKKTLNKFNIKVK